MSTEFLFAFWHVLSNCNQVLFFSIPCEIVYEEALVPNVLLVVKHNDAGVIVCFSTDFTR